jgi:hypothetical protein
MFSTKQRGNIGVAEAILYFTKQGSVVSVPLNDSQDYDLVVEYEGFLQKVQVKTSRQLSEYNIPMVNVKSMGGTSGAIYSTVAESGADLLFVHHEQEGNWLIPITKDMNRSSISLGDKYIEFKV